MTKRQLYYQSPPNPAWITSPESWKPGPPCTTGKHLKNGSYENSTKDLSQL